MALGYFSAHLENRFLEVPFNPNFFICAMNVKIVLLSVLSLAATDSTHATDLNGGTTSGGRVSISSGDWTLTAPSGTAAGSTLYYKGNDSTAGVVTSIATLADYGYNIAGGFTFNINSDSDSVAISDTSKTLQFGNYMNTYRNFIVQNSLGGTTIFNVNKLILTRSNSELKSSSLDANTNLTVNVATSFALNSGLTAVYADNPSINISNGSTLKFVGGNYSQAAGNAVYVYAAGTLDMGSAATINGLINVNGNLVASENMTFNSGSQLYFRQTTGVSTSVSVASGKTITMNDGSTLKIDSPVSLSLAASNLATKKGAIIDLAGNLTLTGTGGGYTTLGSYNISSTGKLTIGTSKASSLLKSNIDTGAVVNLSGTIDAYGGIVLNGGTLNMEEGSSLTLKDFDDNSNKGRILFQSGTLNLNGTANFTRVHGDSTAGNGMIVIYNTNNLSASINVNAANQIGYLYLSAGFVDIILNDVASDILTIDQLGGVAGTIVNIMNFEEQRVKISKLDIASLLDSINIYNADGDFLGTGALDSEGWLIAVPEASSFAAVLGAFALALAARRRKK